MILIHFSEAKENTSFGRGTSTRKAMRKALVAASAASVDNRRGKKHRATSAPSISDDAKEDIALLTKTLKHFLSSQWRRKRRSSISCKSNSFATNLLRVAGEARCFSNNLD